VEINEFEIIADELKTKYMYELFQYIEINYKDKCISIDFEYILLFCNNYQEEFITHPLYLTTKKKMVSIIQTYICNIAQKYNIFPSCNDENIILIFYENEKRDIVLSEIESI